MEKKVGITCDNYKLEKFKAELTKAGYTNFEVIQNKGNLSAIIVKCYEKDFIMIGSICQDVEEHFRAMKN